MNEAMGTRVDLLGPICAIVVLAGAMHWMAPSRADTPQAAEAVTVSATEYYPAQFVLQATDQGGDSAPTF